MAFMSQSLSTRYPSTVSFRDEETKNVLLDAINSTAETALSQETPDLTLFFILIFVVLLPLSLFVIIGNTLVIVAVYTSFQLRERVFYYVVGSMAATDMLVGFSMIPVYYTAIFVDSLKESLFYCLSMITILLVPSMTSILHVLVIAADQYIAVFYSLKYPKIVTQRRIFATIAVIWMFVLSFNTLPYIGWRRKHPNIPLPYCFTDQVWTPSLLCFQFSLCVIAPLCIMIGIYTRIINAARLQARRVDAMPQEFIASDADANAAGQVSVGSMHDGINRPQELQAPVARIRRGLKATKTSAIVLGTFLVFWLPAYSVHITFTFINSSRTEPLHSPTIAILHAASNLLPFISSAANPVIYAFRYQEFRRSFKKSLKISFCKRED